eukprot:3712087-Ditylum_brightwellii.AAC.1
MEINNETSVNFQHLSNLIKGATTKETKSLKKELASLYNQIKAMKVSSTPTKKSRENEVRGYTVALNQKKVVDAPTSN